MSYARHVVCVHFRSLDFSQRYWNTRVNLSKDQILADLHDDEYLIVQTYVEGKFGLKIKHPKNQNLSKNHTKRVSANAIKNVILTLMAHGKDLCRKPILQICIYWSNNSRSPSAHQNLSMQHLKKHWHDWTVWHLKQVWHRFANLTDAVILYMLQQGEIICLLIWIIALHARRISSGHVNIQKRSLKICQTSRSWWISADPQARRNNDGLYHSQKRSLKIWGRSNSW